MTRRVRAVYHGGAFVPREPCDVPADSEVELLIQGPFVLPPEVSEPEERKRILRGLVQRMRQNPIPSAAPPLGREALHDRR